MTLRNRPWLVTIIACLTLFFVLAFIKFTQIRAAIAFGESFPEPSETVHSQFTALSFWRPYTEVVGEIRASRELELRTEVSGMVALVGFNSGDQVSQGQVLLQLDIAEEQAQLAALEPQIELAKKDLKRLEGAVKSRSVSQQLADQAKSNLAVLRAQAVSIREIIANKTVSAPFAGRTGLHDFEVGEFVSSNTRITRLVGSLDTLWVDFSLPQQYANLANGEAVEVKALQNARLNADAVKATVIAVEPSVSSTSRSINARAEILSKTSQLTNQPTNQLTNQLRPGSIVQVSVPVGEQRQIVRLPSTAVRIDAFGSFVYTLSKDPQGATRATRKPIEVIAKQGADSILAAELGAGLEVATIGSFKLRDGILTNIRANPTPTAPAPISDTKPDAAQTEVIAGESRQEAQEETKADTQIETEANQ